MRKSIVSLAVAAYLNRLPKHPDILNMPLCFETYNPGGKQVYNNVVIQISGWQEIEKTVAPPAFLPLQYRN